MPPSDRNTTADKRQLRLGLREGETTIGEVVDRIRRESRDESEKGRWFENLVARVLTDNPEYEVHEVHRWADWPEREDLTELDGRDIGIDLVGRLVDGSWVAIQCKCYEESARVGKPQIDSFLAVSQRAVFSMRWIVATCPWTKTAEAQIKGLTPPVRRIDFIRRYDDPISEEVTARPVREPWPLQAEAIENVVTGLENHDRGRLIMACGTGKTFTSLRVSERVVPAGGRILFLAPSIALVSQARREWLRHTVRDLDCRVVCSDRTAGGRGENPNDIGLSDLECAVTTDPEEISAVLSADDRKTRVVFCTYQSLGHITEAQVEHDAPAFDIAIMDEAHRTTGVTTGPGKAPESGFRAVHNDDRLKTAKRIYMTATPRIYSESSRKTLAKKGIQTVDMSDFGQYGPELHCLTFAEAVNAGLLSDYRVIVLGVHEDAAPPGVSNQLVSLAEGQETSRPLIVSAQDVTRLLGTSLAINGLTEGPETERPGRLHRTIAFANSIARSSFYAEGMKLPELRRITTRRLRAAEGSAAPSMAVESQHLDASDSALVRSLALRNLARADRDGCRTPALQCRAVRRGRGRTIARCDRLHGAPPEPSRHRSGGRAGDAPESGKAIRIHRRADPDRSGAGYRAGARRGDGWLQGIGEGPPRSPSSRWPPCRGSPAIRPGQSDAAAQTRAGRILGPAAPGQSLGCQPRRLRARGGCFRARQARVAGVAGHRASRPCRGSLLQGGRSGSRPGTGTGIAHGSR